MCQLELFGKVVRIKIISNLSYNNFNLALCEANEFISEYCKKQNTI